MSIDAIVQISDEATRAMVLTRAEQLAGVDELHFSHRWASRPDIFIVPEENEVHAGEHNAEKLARACSTVPGARWYSASVFEGEAEEPFEVLNPGRAMSRGDEGQEPLGILYMGQSFLLFDSEGEAAILYSEEEVALVSGSRQFVESYFGDVHAAVREFGEFIEEAKRIWSANAPFVSELEYRDKVFREQIRLP